LNKSFMQALGVLVVVGLAACTTSPNTGPGPAVSPAPQPAAANETRAVIGLLEEFQHWQPLQPDEQRRQLAAATQAYANGNHDYDRLRLAMLLSLPNTPFRDDAHALSLLAPLLTADAQTGGPLRQLAMVLQVQIAERVREVRDEQKRGDELAQKLEALRAIERSISEREQKVRTK
jgi:hypothetical protein